MESEDRWEREQEQAAAAEAAEIGGRVDPVSEDPAREPVEEAGGGYAEGFEIAEQELIDHAGSGPEDPGMRGDPILRDAYEVDPESELAAPSGDADEIGGPDELR